MEDHFPKLCRKEQMGCQFSLKPLDKHLISATVNVTFTVTKRNTKTSPKAIMSEWCSLLQHRSAKMDVTSSAITLKEIGFFSPAHFYSIVSLFIRRGLSFRTVDSHWVEPWKEEICRHNANHIIIFLPSLSDRKNSWRAWIVLRIPFQPLSHTGPRSLCGRDRSRTAESYSQLHMALPNSQKKDIREHSVMNVTPVKHCTTASKHNHSCSFLWPD